MASFQERGKTWQYTVSRMVDGKSKPIRKGGFKTKKEAQVAAAEVETDLRKGVSPNLKPINFDKYFENWINLYKVDIANNTRERYLSTLKTIRDKFEGIPIQNIKKSTYQAFLNEFGETHSKASTKKLNGHIRACVKEAIDEGLIRIDFTRNVTLKGLPEKPKDEKHLHYDESKRLIEILYDRLDQSLTYYLLLLAITSGLRYAELVGLTRQDFDFTNNTITVNKTWGYTRRMPEGFGPTKNESSKRVVKLDNRTMQEFKKLFMKQPDNLNRLVFYSGASKYNVISNNTANKLLKSLTNEINADHISVHGLRHTHASILLYEGVSVYYVSERLGHSTIETTMNHYAHLIKELREKDEQKTIQFFESISV